MESVTLGYLLSHTATILYRQADQVLLERLGIGMSQFKILMLLKEESRLQQRTLADSLGQTEASVSRQIKLLCEKGMLVSRVNKENRREHITVPTVKGLKIVHAAEDILATFHQPAFAELTDKERQRLTEMLTMVHAHTCQPTKPYACDHQAMGGSYIEALVGGGKRID
ncbi:MAG TPA: MarR family winged helix-turn-helix transcriptional regulator [Candidatus Saccharimonadales bacterium]|nr:MarR family winged helix-turn-helix transcriptional regulator [Candidatus Saccharimonadales bacterium]